MRLLSFTAIIQASSHIGKALALLTFHLSPWNGTGQGSAVSAQIEGGDCLTAEGAPNMKFLPFYGLRGRRERGGRSRNGKALRTESEWRKVSSRPADKKDSAQAPEHLNPFTSIRRLPSGDVWTRNTMCIKAWSDGRVVAESLTATSFRDGHTLTEHQGRCRKSNLPS